MQEILGSSLQGTWHLRHPIVAKATCKLWLESVKSPSFRGRVKRNPEIRKHKGCAEVEPKETNKNKHKTQPKRQRSSQKAVNIFWLLLLQPEEMPLCAEGSWSALGWGCGQLSSCRQGEPVRQRQAQLSCLQSLEWEFHCSCSVDQARWTSLILND